MKLKYPTLLTTAIHFALRIMDRLTSYTTYGLIYSVIIYCPFFGTGTDKCFYYL